ncbi:MAG: DUF2961 domain-containing protein [Clostridiales Family XIII bacterium]|jgi:hypothetical protein|nr:DUF2961 domain-containing protein [Clostridiales Family XIII bacterium]
MTAGFEWGLDGITQLSGAKSRSVSAENPTGGKGMGGRAETGTGVLPASKLGVGWKVSPSIVIPADSSRILADVKGRGKISHIWLTTEPARYRSLVFEFYWDDAATPAVRIPVGDFFCNGWCDLALVNSLPIAVNPAGGFNSYFPMPFFERAQLLIRNLSDADAVVYYQVDYLLCDPPERTGYFHAVFNRSKPLPYKSVHTIADGVRGRGHYVGAYLAWQSNSNGWWGEGEVKFYIDGDDEFPTVCGTGTEDYFGGAWNFDMGGAYREYSTAFLGLPQVIRPDGLYRSQQRFGMYRWHIPDTICFETDLRVTVQALGWRETGKEYLPLQDDIASSAFLYLEEKNGIPGAELTKEYLEVV